jgi:hypothetical protein
MNTDANGPPLDFYIVDWQLSTNLFVERLSGIQIASATSCVKVVKNQR